MLSVASFPATLGTAPVASTHRESRHLSESTRTCLPAFRPGRARWARCTHAGRPRGLNSASSTSRPPLMQTSTSASVSAASRSATVGTCRAPPTTLAHRTRVACRCTTASPPSANVPRHARPPLPSSAGTRSSMPMALHSPTRRVCSTAASAALRTLHHTASTPRPSASSSATTTPRNPRASGPACSSGPPTTLAAALARRHVRRRAGSARRAMHTSATYSMGQRHATCRSSRRSTNRTCTAGRPRPLPPASPSHPSSPDEANSTFHRSATPQARLALSCPTRMSKRGPRACPRQRERYLPCRHRRRRRRRRSSSSSFGLEADLRCTMRAATMRSPRRRRRPALAWRHGASGRRQPRRSGRRRLRLRTRRGRLPCASSAHRAGSRRPPLSDRRGIRRRRRIASRASVGQSAAWCPATKATSLLRLRMWASRILARATSNRVAPRRHTTCTNVATATLAAGTSPRALRARLGKSSR
mmetsp:Transcript_9107/g.23838  ORF Transcript_9107/g.23838 Transcript_9107/m.23838 type:complete len:475 (-) Transcript_9107:557-1981(-)